MSSSSSGPPPQIRGPGQFAHGRQPPLRILQREMADTTVKLEGKRSTPRVIRHLTSGPRPGPRFSGAHTPPHLSQKLAAAAVAALTHTEGGQR